ncbi:MAG: hypothetical protein G8345_08755 [Magnetococcales bacterium]|nr:hypothetical protein [Magnetococcales bacterium]
MNPTQRAILALACLMPMVAACQQPTKTYPMVSQPLTIQEEAVPDITLTAYQAADVLYRSFTEFYNFRWPVLATTFVDTDNLNQTSPLGRLLSRQISSRLTQIGFNMVETRLRNTMSINKTGEFILSRELKLIEKEHQARAILVGQLTVADRQVYVTSQIIRLKDQVVLATADFTLPVTSTVRNLLGMPTGVPIQDALKQRHTE